MIQRVLVADDEPLARAYLTRLLLEIAPDVEVVEARNGIVAVDVIVRRRPDVVFLDVQMPGLSGVEVVQRVGPEAMPPTVFVTAFDRHAVQAFEMSAVDYLLKPFDADRFAQAWRRVEARYTIAAVVSECRQLASLLGTLVAPVAESGVTAPAMPLERVVVTKGLRTYIVRLGDVDWIEAAGNYVVLHAAQADHRIRVRFSVFESRLDPAHFVRIHRGVIVSIEAIRELQPWFGGDQVLVLKNGRQLRVSRSRRAAVARRLAGEG